MEPTSESCEVHADDNKVLSEKKHRRTVKTPSQVEALEKFYNEHKYPTEEEKSQLAESIGLTEKQVSGWFCHRRLKDKRLSCGEVYANGRQDHSSGVIQDRGSGLRQDSCGSTKQGECRIFDQRDAEITSFTGHDIPTADPTYELERHCTGNYTVKDDTSSGSSSPLQDGFYLQNDDPFDCATSRYLTQNRNTMPRDAKGLKVRTGPAGYLKVKGQVENAAITAVKRQLGRHYRGDGPPLGVEFQPLPPGAFESPNRDPVNETLYIGEPVLPCAPDVRRIHKKPNLDTTCKEYNSKMNYHHSDLDGTKYEVKHGSDHSEKYSYHQFPQKSSSYNSNPFPGRNSFVKYSDGEMPGYDGRDNSEMRAKLGVGGMRRDSVSSLHLSSYGGKFCSEKSGLWPHSNDVVTPNVTQTESFEYKSSNLAVKQGGVLDLEDRGLSRRMIKEGKFDGERTTMSEYCDPVQLKIDRTSEMRVSKRVRDESSQQQFSRKASMVYMPPRPCQIRRPVAKTPSSFGDNETSSSVD